MIVLLADDHAPITYVSSLIVRQALSELQDYQLHVVSDVDSLLLELTKVQDGRCLVLLDLSMPGKPKRLSLVAEVLRRCPQAAVVIYSASAQPLLVMAALTHGVRGYVSKGSSLSSLQDAVTAAANGDCYIDDTIAIQEVNDHPWNALTQSEREVVIALAKGQDLRSLAEGSGRAYQTVANHKYAAMQKLELAGNGQIQGFILQHGLDYLLDD